MLLACMWSAWVNGRCSVTCGTGSYTRQRTCLDQFSGICSSCNITNSTTINATTINGTRPCYYPDCTSGMILFMYI